MADKTETTHHDDLMRQKAHKHHANPYELIPTVKPTSIMIARDTLGDDFLYKRGMNDARAHGSRAKRMADAVRSQIENTFDPTRKAARYRKMISDN